MKAVNIQWDIDPECCDVELPKEIEIPTDLADEDNLLECLDDDYLDKISDYLSDVTGYCHKGFEIKE